MNMTFFGGVLLVVAVSSCRLSGAPAPGSACDSSVDQPECITEKSLGTCTDNKWVESSCDRCSNSQEIVCTHAVGDSCEEGTGYCLNSTSMRKCVDGKYADVSCVSCEKRGENGVTFYTCS